MVMAGIFFLDLMAIFIRMLSATYPVTELSAFRNFFGIIPSAIVLLASAEWRARGRSLRMRQWWLALMRASAVVFAQICFYVALTRLEFATASTLAFAGPMFVTALSVPILGDRVGPWRWSAVLIGFLGVILIMKPGSDVFTLAAILPIGAAAGYATSSVLVRLVDKDVPSPLLNIYTTFATMIGSCMVMLVMHEPVAIQSWSDFGLIAVMGTSGGFGVLCLIIGYRLVQPSLIAPFEFTGILIAFGLGWVFFGEAPVERLFPGVLLIVAAGLLIVWRERRASARDKAEGVA